jgi:GTP 3',8-cyclase
VLRDPFGRQITYLRISITDRCNLRCVYCMPPEGIPWKSHAQIMRYEEIADVVRIAAENGIREVRLTGGEPLVRHNLPELVGMISAIPGIEDISLTTNGALLEKYAQALSDAGLQRVNISLDTLDPEKFRRITRFGTLEQTLRGIEAVEECGLKPIKINTVAMRGVNDDEIVKIALLSMDHPWDIRFIELMPINNQRPWGEGFESPDQIYFSLQEMKALLEPLGLKTEEIKVGSGPAREYRLRGGMGTVGFISPLGEHFCVTCNRLRLTADGYLRPCLLSDVEIPLLQAMRAGEPILPLLQKAIEIKPAAHELNKDHLPEERSMNEIGG